MRLHPKKKRKIMHKGIDLANVGCDGWPVVALGPGRVVKSGWENGYGYVVNIVHELEGEKIYTRSAHLRKKGRVAAGTVVNKGMQVGLCNNTGGSTGTHLHFEVLRGGEFGQPLDPKKFLSAVHRAEDSANE
jgi:murein DD-endopeptidase MepM/ murein hydrolase activator NlpD